VVFQRRLRLLLGSLQHRGIEAADPAFLLVYRAAVDKALR
jgi:hypothetical protein